MKREQIVELLNSNIKIQECYNPRRDTCDQWIEGIDKAADAIIALPIEVPREEEINEYARRESIVQVEEDGELIDYESCLDEYYIVGAKWAINEILKRNGNLSL